MKTYIIQPYYSFKESDIELCMSDMLAHLDSIGEDADLIVLPEYSDVPADCRSKESFHAAVEKYNELVKMRAQEAAKRCHAIVFVNAADKTPTGYRNTTYAIDREGNFVGKYYKAHPAPSEVKTEKEGGNELDVSYSYEFRQPDVIEIEGIRFGFMTCYDFYFYENFAPLARQNIDVIIGCSHQRTDTHEALSIINRFLCYNTNAYLIRSSVSLGLESKICGCSCIIAPNGDVLVDMKSEIGVAFADIDPHAKYYKAAGYKGAQKSHYEYIEEGRRPWLYRNGGASVVPFDKYMPYPRLCAHRGFNTVAPENTMPAFGAAVAMGAQEIEFDLWATADGEIVTAHDPNLERVSDGHGNVWEHTLAELKKLDFGVKFGEKYKDLRIPTFEEILQKLAGRVIMNIHVKIWDVGQAEPYFEKIAALIRKYDCERHVYFMSVNSEALIEMRKLLPNSGYCQGAGRSNAEMIDLAIKYGFDKIQLVCWYPYDKSMIDRCHENGIKVNFCQADKPSDAKWVLDMGVDCVLTNDFQYVKSGLDF
ncbi:MAG: hypothetical protein IJY39_08630 [Clostridia bacterium]|nr:hypothetical protein [Clostridia bacterium]